MCIVTRHHWWLCCADVPSGKVLGDQFFGEGAGGQGEEGAGAGSSTACSGRGQQQAAGLPAPSDSVLEAVTAAIISTEFQWHKVVA